MGVQGWKWSRDGIRMISLFICIWGRCYDHNFRRFFPIFGDFSQFSAIFPNFRRFFPIFGEIFGNVMIKFFQNLALFWVKNAIFCSIFGENIVKIITSVPGQLNSPLNSFFDQDALPQGRIGYPYLNIMPKFGISSKAINSTE
jgi:hypothetical protein